MSAESQEIADSHNREEIRTRNLKIIEENPAQAIDKESYQLLHSLGNEGHQVIFDNQINVANGDMDTHLRSPDSRIDENNDRPLTPTNEFVNQ